MVSDKCTGQEKWCIAILRRQDSSKIPNQNTIHSCGAANAVSHSSILKTLNADLSLMRSCAAVEVEEAVAVCAQVATHVTQDYGSSLTIVMVITHRL